MLNSMHVLLLLGYGLITVPKLHGNGGRLKGVVVATVTFSVALGFITVI
jgi:hypothetical protein